MASTRRKLDPDRGMVFEHTYKGDRCKMVVVMRDEGIRYEVDGALYKSPTAAAKSIVGDQFINGHRFWHMDS